MIFQILGNYYIAVLIIVFLAFGLRVVKEYERGVRFTLGKYSGVIKPGLRFIIPVIQTWQRVDIRIVAVDVPNQDAITRDNVSVKVNAVLYYHVTDATKAVIEVEHYQYAVSQLAQTTMRDVVGEVPLDDMLSKREELSKKIGSIVDKATDPWGIKINSVELKHVELPDQMKRIMGKEAEAERIKRAVIIKAEGEMAAAENMAKAGKKLSSVDGALHLRTLQSINDMATDPSNTVIFPIPVELLRALGKKK